MWAISHFEIKEVCAKLGHSYISSELVSLDGVSRTFVDYICRCGSRRRNKLATLRQGFGCQDCKANNLGIALEKYSFEYIFEQFSTMGQVLLDYNRGGKPFTYLCKCGNVQTVEQFSFNLLFRWQCCRQCRKPHNFDPVARQDQSIRQTSQYKKWREDCLVRDSYTCVICGMDENLNVHHVIAFNKSLDKIFDKDNGITLCVNCHTEFHSIYGYNVTEKQFKLYLASKGLSYE